MIVLRDFALFILPGLVVAGGWLYALRLRCRIRLGNAPQRSTTPPASLAP